MSDEARERRKAKRGSGKVERDEAARREAERYLAKAGQLTMFELAGAAGPLPDDAKPAAAGRPVGAGNTAPQEFRRFVLATKGDFVGRFAGLSQVDVFALAAALRCTPLEAVYLQLDAAKLAAPYVYQQQPRAVEIGGDAGYFAGMLFMAGAAGQPAAPGLPAGGGMLDELAALAGRPPDLEEIQALEPVKFVASEPAVSEPASDDEEEAP